ncbi:glycosyltransferase family 4 protein [Methylocaldum sp. MU1018]
MESMAEIPRSGSGAGSSGNEKRRIVFVNRFFYPDHSATSQMLSGLVFDLAKDRSVWVVAGRQLYENPKAALPLRETVSGVTVRRVRASAFGRHRLAGRALDYFTFHLGAAAALVRIARPGDLIVAKTDPPLISVVAAAVAALRGCAVVNWIQDLFPEAARALEIRGMKRSAPLLRRLRNWSLRRAAANVVLGERMRERLQAEGVAPSRIRPIANWADGESLRPIAPENNPLRAEWGLGDAFVVGYSGNLGRAHEFGTVLDAIGRLRDRPGIRFLFIGGGAQRAEIERFVRERNLSNVSFRPYQPAERLAYSLSAADIHLVSLRPELEGLIVPSKFYGVCAAGRATLYVGDPEGDIPRIIRGIGCGRAIEPGDGASLATAVDEWSKDPDGVRAMGQRARAAFERSFDKRHAMQAWRALLGSLAPDEAENRAAASAEERI